MPRLRIFLFDIDGTLLRGDGAGKRAMDKALRAALAERGQELAADRSPFDGVRFDGHTDRAIVRDALDHLGLPASADTIQHVLDHYLVALRAELARGASLRALAGAAEVARALAEHGLVGLGTGNIEAAALLKVKAVGMDDLFRFGGYGSDAEARAELLAIGAERGAALAGRARAECEVVVIGDTPRDIQAGRAIGARVVAVATGGTPAADLAAHAPDALLHSLGETAAVLDVLLR